MKYLDQIKLDARVSDAWSEGSDGYWIDLHPGFINAEAGTHMVHEWTIHQLRESFKEVEPCRCLECGHALAKRHGQKPSARFWALVNCSWVKLTLRPGDVLHWRAFEYHDEGSCLYEKIWTLDADTPDLVLWETGSSGHDCDGSHNHSRRFSCRLHRLGAGDRCAKDSFRNDSGEVRQDNFEDFNSPDWERE